MPILDDLKNAEQSIGAVADQSVTESRNLISTAIAERESLVSQMDATMDALKEARMKVAEELSRLRRATEGAPMVANDTGGGSPSDAL